MIDGFTSFFAYFLFLELLGAAAPDIYDTAAQPPATKMHRSNF